MAKRTNVSDELQKEHRQLLKLLHGELGNDQDIQNIIRVYLKFGGEKLARYGIELINRRFQEEIQKLVDELPASDSVNSEGDISEDIHRNTIPYSESDDLDDEDEDDYHSDY